MTPTEIAAMLEKLKQLKLEELKYVAPRPQPVVYCPCHHCQGARYS